MRRQLRTRTSRPNYATMFQFEDAEDAGPSGQRPFIQEEEDSGSDFAPEANAGEQAEEEEEDEEDDLEDEVEDEAKEEEARQGKTSWLGSISAHDISVVSTGRNTGRPSTSKASQPRRKAISLAPSLSVSGAGLRQAYSLPNVHHRHRAIPLWRKTGLSECPTEPPRLFGPNSTELMNSWGAIPAISERIGRAWGYNVGPGPLWELLEDRGWFKEAIDGVNADEEKKRRPRVHEDVHASTYTLLSAQDARSYLPHETRGTDHADSHPPPPVICSLGPFGEQTRVQMQMFDSRKIVEFIPGSRSHVFNAGAPVWGLDWCPIHPDDRPRNSYKQYLAVAPFPSRDHSPVIGSRVQRPAPACIQIWSLGPSQEPATNDNAEKKTGKGTGREDDAGEVQCEMVLCLDAGPALEVKWCPLPANTSSERSTSEAKLGILAGTFEDGSLSLYAVPYPEQVRAEAEATLPEGPVYVRVAEPLIRIEVEGTTCYTLDWANSEVIAVGCTNGAIAVYNVREALKASDRSNILPTHYFTVHQSAVRAISWIRAPSVSATGEYTDSNPTVIASGGYDGVECVTDIQDLLGNVVNRTRDVINTLCYSAYAGGVITIDHENMVKSYSLSPAMLGRGHTILEPDGPPWSVHASDYHPQLAVGASDGSCLTTNTLRSTRRGGSVPFLMHKIYQLDYSRTTGEFRMLERFLPQELQDRPTATRANKVMPVGTGAWPPEIGVQRVVWNDGNGIGRTPLLASATGSGLCRVDWLLGRWMRDRVPYYGVQGIRGEIGDVAMDEDDSE
ncbi:hypothetical protein OBBRIDRAFT_817558 [Obba rivulosa]|uniref:Uncharacterized protein n=1 Tax=Obba rivulosa TaxID=1052685 RepID=A0A8E2DQB8_9APHY|nr:hypothetical protein OBBRIDRAFT_817558 [Obba rivulosa]